MHGSINWFDKSHYQEWKAYWKQTNYNREPPFAVFDGRMDDNIHTLLDEPFPSNDPLKNLYIVENLDRYFDDYLWYERGRISDSPFIIAPSYHKLISLSYLGNFWGGFTNSIIGPNRIAIIGFSLPQHDDYIRQPMYWYIRNFYKHGEPMEGKKSKLKIIDFRQSQKEISELEDNYRFVEKEWTTFYLNGFCEDALDIIFSEE